MNLLSRVKPLGRRLAPIKLALMRFIATALPAGLPKMGLLKKANPLRCGLFQLLRDGKLAGKLEIMECCYCWVGNAVRSSRVTRDREFRPPDCGEPGISRSA
jgi:hypothetical protein